MNDRFRDENGRLVPAVVFLESLHCGLMRDLTAALAMLAFVAFIAIGADWWVHG